MTGDLTIEANFSLASLYGLENIASVGGTVKIVHNNSSVTADKTWDPALLKLSLDDAMETGLESALRSELGLAERAARRFGWWFDLHCPEGSY